MVNLFQDKTEHMQRIIQIIISAFFKILVPLSYITFILAGIMSALVSALIEYEIFDELYQKNVAETDFLFSVPLLIVIAFESTKVFLIFLNKQYTKSGEESYLKDKAHFKVLRVVLITISVVATLIFSFYNLHNPEYDKVLAEEEAKIEKRYTELKDIASKSFDEELERKTFQYVEDNKIQQAEIDKQKGIYFRGTNEFRGEKYDEATKLKAENFENINRVTKEVQSDRRQKIQELLDDEKREKEDAKNKLQTSSSAGNKMLTATLQILNMEAEYPQIQYILLILLLSVLLSVGLEYIIWSAFTVLAINHGDLFQLDINRKDWSEKHKMMNDTIDKMNKTEAKSFGNRAKNWRKAFVKDAKNKARKFRDDINDVIN